MMWIAGAVLTVFASAFVFTLLFGLPSKDEPMEESKCGELENFEAFWHKDMEENAQ